MALKKEGKLVSSNWFVVGCLLLLVLALSLSLINAANYSVKVTNEHPFLLANGKYVTASELKIGDELKTVDGKKARVTGIHDVFSENPFEVYNLETALYHDFVLPGGVVVHNSNRVPIIKSRCAGGVCSGKWCFSGDTLITMEDGKKKEIKNIKSGDRVLSWDFEKNKSVEARVDELITSSHSDIYLINSKIKVTSEHAFWTKEVGWASINPSNTLLEDRFEVKELKISYHLFDESGNYIEIFNISKNFGEIPTYNLEIQNYHNYFADDVLVHNQCDDPYLEGILSPTESETITLLSEADKLKSMSGAPGLVKARGEYKDVFMIDLSRFGRLSEIPEIANIIRIRNIREPVIKIVEKTPRRAGLPETTSESFTREISLSRRTNSRLKINSGEDIDVDKSFFVEKVELFGSKKDSCGNFERGIIIEEKVNGESAEYVMDAIELYAWNNQQQLAVQRQRAIDLGDALTKKARKVQENLDIALTQEGLFWGDGHSENIKIDFKSNGVSRDVAVIINDPNIDIPSLEIRLSGPDCGKIFPVEEIGGCPGIGIFDTFPILPNRNN